jgi:hypothetical protein
MGRGLTSGLTGRNDQLPGLQTQDLVRKRGDWKFPVHALHHADRAAWVV